MSTRGVPLAATGRLPLRPLACTRRMALRVSAPRRATSSTEHTCRNATVPQEDAGKGPREARPPKAGPWPGQKAQGLGAGTCPWLGLQL